MSMNTWSQYVAMDDPLAEPHRLETILEGLEDWNDEFELGDAWNGDEPLAAGADE